MTPAEAKTRKVAEQYALLAKERPALQTGTVKADAFRALIQDNPECAPFAETWAEIVDGGAR